MWALLYYRSTLASVFTAVRDLGRLREISTVLVRHGFGEVLVRMGLAGLLPSATYVVEDEERRKIAWPERIRLVLQELGPSFIKLGQIASTRADVLPATLLVELKKLQDAVPPVPFEGIAREIESSLAASIPDMFDRFEETPLATASIGQVHRARLKPLYDVPRLLPDGSPQPPESREVVVKVQRPGVRETVERDLELLHLLATVLERSIAEARIYDPVGLVQQFDRSITAELDFTLEASNAERFQRNFQNYPGIAFPLVYKAASSRRVLTTEYFDGLKIHAAVAQGASGPYLARQAVGIVVKMIFEDGFFHADPHPGNIIILGPAERPIIGMIDLGMVGRLSPELRDKSIRLMVAAVRQDTVAVADALYAIGRPTKKIDMAQYRSEVALLTEKYLGRPLKEIELSSMVRDLVAAAVKYGVEIPTDFMMVGKALMTVEGIGRELDPDLDVFSEARPHFLALLRKRYAPEQIGNDVWRGVERFASIAHDVPVYLQEVLDDLRLGRLQIQTSELSASPTLDRLGRRIFSGMVVASLNLAAGVSLLATFPYRFWVSGALFLGAWLSWAAHVTRDETKAWMRRGKQR